MNREGKIIGYSLFTVAVFFSMLIGVILDTINSYPPGAIITLFGMTATRQEWFQNVFLVGIMCIMIPMSLIIGYIGGSLNLDKKEVIIVILTSLIIGSAIWDLLFIEFYVIPNNLPPETLLPWFDFFGVGFLKLAETSLTLFKIESGIIWMDVDFMIFFSYVRFLIFVPLLAYELWRFSQ